MTNRLLVAVTRSAALLLPLSLAAFVAVAPRGTVTKSYRNFAAGRQAKRILRDHWDSVSSLGARLDRGQGQVTVVVFSDYECPACRRSEPILEAFIKSRPDIGVMFRHLPLVKHPMAQEAALASICAQDQGRFDAMHSLLMRDSSWIDGTDWSNEAQAAGIPDSVAFKECRSSPRALARLTEDLSISKRLGIKATPTLVTRHGVKVGVGSVQLLQQLLSPQR